MLTARDIQESDLPGLAWSGAPLHVAQLAEQIRNDRAGRLLVLCPTIFGRLDNHSGPPERGGGAAAHYLVDGDGRAHVSANPLPAGQVFPIPATVAASFAGVRLCLTYEAETYGPR